MSETTYWCCFSQSLDKSAKKEKGGNEEGADREGRRGLKEETENTRIAKVGGDEGRERRGRGRGGAGERGGGGTHTGQIDLLQQRHRRAFNDVE